MREPIEVNEHAHDTRKAAENSEAQKLAKATSAAAELLTGASSFACSSCGLARPLELLERSFYTPRINLSEHPAALSLFAILHKLSEDYENTELATVLFEILPHSMFTVVGKAFNQECRGLSYAHNKSTLSHRYNCSSNGVQSFLSEALMTQSQQRGTASDTRKQHIVARRMALLSIVGFTINPSDCFALQHPLAQIIAQGQVVHLHNLTHALGLSVSHTVWSSSSSARQAASCEVSHVTLRAWMAASQGSNALYVKNHLDNFDIPKKQIHMLMSGITRCAPPSPRRFRQYHIFEIEAENLFKKTKPENEASLLQDRACVAKSEAAMAIPGIEALVNSLLGDMETAVKTVTELEALRSMRRPGRKALPRTLTEGQELARDEGELKIARRALIVKDTLGADFVVSIGEELTVFMVFSEAQCAIVRKESQSAWVPTSVTNNQMSSGQMMTTKVSTKAFKSFGQSNLTSPPQPFLWAK